MTLLPIGSILEVTGKRAVVIGYSFDDKNNSFTASYIICGYPIGFVTIEQLGLVPVDAEMEVIFEGFRDERFYSFIKNKLQILDLAKDITVSEWNAHLDKFEQLISLEENDE